MSLDACPLPPVDPREYSHAVAVWLAEAYASGDSGTTLRELHLSAPERVPGPLVIARWRSAWPAFDALMAEAERVRAASLMEATIPIADNAQLQAASAKNAIAARWRMAEALDPDRWGQRRILAGDAERPMGGGVRLTDAQLEAIIRGQDARLVLDIAPTAPLLQRETPEARGSETGPASTSFGPAECLSQATSITRVTDAVDSMILAERIRQKISAEFQKISDGERDG